MNTIRIIDNITGKEIERIENLTMTEMYIMTDRKRSEYKNCTIENYYTKDTENVKPVSTVKTFH